MHTSHVLYLVELNKCNSVVLACFIDTDRKKMIGIWHCNNFCKNETSYLIATNCSAMFLDVLASRLQDVDHIRAFHTTQILTSIIHLSTYVPTYTVNQQFPSHDWMDNLTYVTIKHLDINIYTGSIGERYILIDWRILCFSLALRGKSQLCLSRLPHSLGSDTANGEVPLCLSLAVHLMALLSLWK